MVLALRYGHQVSLPQMEHILVERNRDSPAEFVDLDAMVRHGSSRTMCKRRIVRVAEKMIIPLVGDAHLLFPFIVFAASNIAATQPGHVYDASACRQ